MSDHEQLSVVMIGVTRATAIKSTQELLKGTKYDVVACLDMTESPEQHRFSPTNLGTVLHALHPQPRALITGTAVDTAMCNDIQPVWQAYVSGLRRSSCWVAVSLELRTTESC